MTASGWLALLSALAAVLSALFLLAHVVRKARGLAGHGGGPGTIEIVSRVGLAPRQGVATVRVHGRLVLVSWGDGGVRALAELGADELEEEAVVEGPEGRAHEGELGPRVPAPRFLPAYASALAAAVRPDGAPRRAAGLAIRARAFVGSARRRITALRAALALALLLLPSATAPAALQAQVASAPEAEAVAPVGPEAPVAAPEGPGAVGPRMRVSLGGADEEERLQLSGPVGTVVFIGFMTLIPTLLLLMTSFTRILIVLHLLKQALGTQTAPPAHLLAAIALLLTGFVMAPTFEEIQVTAVEPWMDGHTDELQMLATAAVPMRDFMLGNTREEDLASFIELRDAPLPETVDDIPLVVLTSAFVTSELTSAFQMGFALFLPFVVLDIVVASVLMSMGMFMLPPVMVSLPFKLLLFVLVDGWSLVMGSLVRSF